MTIEIGDVYETLGKGPKNKNAAYWTSKYLFVIGNKTISYYVTPEGYWASLDIKYLREYINNKDVRKIA